MNLESNSLVTVHQPEPNLAEYYRSIEGSLRETIDSMEADLNDRSYLIGLLLLFSIIPLVPYLLYRFVAPHLGSIVIYGKAVPVQSFGFWYVASVLMMICLNFLHSKASNTDSRTWIPAPEMRFAHCYSVVNELGKYERNRLPSCLDNAIRFWRWLLNSIPGALGLGPDPFRGEKGWEFPPPNISRWDWSPGRHFSSLDVFSKQPWFKLESNAALILTAFKELPSKISDRLKDGKDLSAVATCLSHLAGYLYSVIPGISSAGQSEELRTFGNEHLKEFARAITQLTVYESEPTLSESEPKSEAALSQRDSNALSDANPLVSRQKVSVRFLLWWACIQVLVVIGVIIGSHWKSSLWLEPAVIAMMIGTPLVVAAQMARATHDDHR